MKKFSEFIVEETYNREKHIKKLAKMAKTLENQIRRTNHSSKNMTTWRLISKYDDLVQEIRDKDYEGWKKFCNDRDWSTSHRGNDFLA
jgi:HPt (histidine-containing phosphotransfer) domain-containing protein